MFGAIARTRQWAENVFYGWWVLAACFGLQILTSNFTLQSFGAYISVMQPEFGWSRTSFAVAFSIQQAGSGILGPLQGWLIGRFGARSILRVGIVVFSVALMLFSRVNSLTAFYLVYALISVGASLAGFLTLNSVAAQWFERRRSTAFALLQTGLSSSGLLVPLVAWSLVANGWRSTAFFTGVIVLLLGIPLTFLVGNRPEDYGLAPDGVRPEPGSGVPAAKKRDFTVTQALQTRAFWLLSFGHATALMVVFAVLTHLVLHLEQDLGFSLQLAATLVAVMTTMSVVGQLLGGFLGDAFNKRFLATGAMFGHAVGLLILAFGQTLPWVVAFAVIHGVAWGLRGPLMQSLRADYFGRTSFAQILGFSNIIVTLGTISGPILAGAFADRFGTYTLGFLVLSGLAALGSLFFVFATPPRHPSDPVPS